MIRPPQCPICDKPVVGQAAREANWFPFCSERCRRVDLFRWSEGKYAIVEPVDPARLAAELEQRRTELEQHTDAGDETG